MQFLRACWLYLSSYFILISKIFASAGDRSYVHQKCLQECKSNICSQFSDITYAQTQYWSYRLLGWSCLDDCDYECMWKTVEAFKKDGNSCPQFKGKWPFIRFAGVQEPASVIFSLMNAVPNVIALIKLRRTVPKSTPMYYAWQFNFVISINAWTWSVIYHSRDMIFTERMDYFSATLLVIMSVYMWVIRVFGSSVLRVGPVFVILVLFYIYHVYYLVMVRFDYGYNMKAMITIGVTNSILWLIWCYQTYRRQTYVWKAAVALITGNLLLLLEAFDFPPFLWTFDAHSLWHAGTAPLIWLWSSFIFDDLNFMNSKLKLP